jgi:hypothetical protein
LQHGFGCVCVFILHSFAPVASLWMHYPHMDSYVHWHLNRIFVLSLWHDFGCTLSSCAQACSLVLVQGSITWLGCLCNMVLDACVSSYCTALPLWHRYGCVIHTCTAMFTGSWSGYRWLLRMSLYHAFGCILPSYTQLGSLALDQIMLTCFSDW